MALVAALLFLIGAIIALISTSWISVLLFGGLFFLALAHLGGGLFDRFRG